MIVSYDFAKTPQNLCYLFYQCQYALDRLLPSSRLLTDQTIAKTAMIDCQISINKLLFGA